MPTPRRTSIVPDSSAHVDRFNPSSQTRVPHARSNLIPNPHPSTSTPIHTTNTPALFYPPTSQITTLPNPSHSPPSSLPPSPPPSPSLPPPLLLPSPPPPLPAPPPPPPPPPSPPSLSLPSLPSPPLSPPPPPPPPPLPLLPLLPLPSFSPPLLPPQSLPSPPPPLLRALDSSPFLRVRSRPASAERALWLGRSTRYASSSERQSMPNASRTLPGIPPKRG